MRVEQRRLKQDTALVHPVDLLRVNICFYIVDCENFDDRLCFDLRLDHLGDLIKARVKFFMS